MGQARVVLIFGGGSGIGRAAALRFAADSALVVICGRSWNDLEETRFLAGEAGERVEPFKVDVTDGRAVAEFVEQVVHRFGAIDVVVNSAGQAVAKPFLETSDQEWRGLLEINLLGTVNCCKAVLPYMMKARAGVIINVSSTLGRKAIGGMSAYCASKFAVIGLTQSLAAEMKNFEVRVCAICPGATDTPLHRAIVGDELALQAMPPTRVAQLICAVASEPLRFPSGSDSVIDRDAPSSSPWFLGGFAQFFSRNGWPGRRKYPGGK